MLPWARGWHPAPCVGAAVGAAVGLGVGVGVGLGVGVGVGAAVGAAVAVAAAVASADAAGVEGSATPTTKVSVPSSVSVIVSLSSTIL